MFWEESFGMQLEKFLRPEQFIFSAPMSEQTTFKIGGEADLLIFPSSAEEVSKIFKLVDLFDLPCVILGNGSNVLVRDKGIRGVVVKFTEKFFGNIRCEGDHAYTTEEFMRITGVTKEDLENILALDVDHISIYSFHFLLNLKMYLH